MRDFRLTNQNNICILYYNEKERLIMPFIPDKPELHRRVRLTRDIKVFGGTFTKGTEMTITEIGDRGPTLMDDEGHTMREMGLERPFYTYIHESGE